MNTTELRPSVVQRWKVAGIIREGASRAEMSAIEQRHGVKLPDELVSLFLRADGMEENRMDDEMIRFWPVKEWIFAVEEMPKADPKAHEGILLFADYSLWAHGYGIHLNEGQERGCVAIIGGDSPMIVARSFLEFLQNYLNDPSRLFGVLPKAAPR